MKNFSHVALFSVVLLVSGSVNAMTLSEKFAGLRKAVAAKCTTAGTATVVAFGAVKGQASTAWTASKKGVKNAAKAVWTPGFVKSEVKPAVEASGSLDESVVAEAPDAVYALHRGKAYAYRAALITAIAAPIAYGIYAKYGKAIAKNAKALTQYVNAKLFGKKRIEIALR